MSIRLHYRYHIRSDWTLSTKGRTILKRLRSAATQGEEKIMTWTTPVLVELCIGLEINGYLPAEF